MKKDNLLVFDLGNTSIHLGFFKKNKLVRQWRLATKKLFSIKRIKLPEKIDLAIGCSVVPLLEGKLKKLIKPEPLFVNYKNIPEIKIAVKNPAEVGADRLVNALAVCKKYKKAAIIVDLGTAVTIDVVTQDGRYLGGIIFPGVKLSAEILAQKTAKLPLVSLARPKELIGCSTIEAIRSGLFFGMAALINGLVRQIKKTFPQRKFLVVATGGDVEFFKKVLTEVEIFNQFLILEGLLLASRKIDE